MEKKYTKAELVELVKKSNEKVLNYYEVVTFEEEAEEYGLNVEDLRSDADGWMSYGGEMVGCLRVKDEYFDMAAAMDEQYGRIWESGFCGVPFGSEGKPRTANGLGWILLLEEGCKFNAEGGYWEE